METEIIIIPAHEEHKRDRKFEALVIPGFPERKGLVVENEDNAWLLWKPSDKLNDQKLEIFTATVKKMRIEEELGLEILLQNEHIIEDSLMGIRKWRNGIRVQHWTPADVHTFEKYFLIFGKNFVELRKHLPSKSMGDILKFYFNWKRKRGIPNIKYARIKDIENERKARLKEAGNEPHHLIYK